MRVPRRSARKKLAIWTALLLAAAAAVRASAAPWVAGYYTGWEQSQLPFSSVDLTALDAVIDFAVVPSADGALDNGSANEMSAGLAARVAAVHAAGKKILYTVGGVGTQAAFEGAMSSTYQSTFISNLVNFMTANGYDGIDLDMEEMGASDVTPYVAFATALRASMTAASPGSLLTAAVTWDPSAFGALNGVFDHINLETYSLSGTWYNETWHNAPVYSAGALGGGTLASVNSMVQQFEAAGVSAAKLGIGITFDPYIWTGGSGVTKPQQTWTSAPTVSETYYHAIAQTYGLVEGASTSGHGAVYGWDSSAQAAYLSVAGSPASSDAFISYDDVSAIDAKIAYANANGIGSVIIWDLAGGWRTDLPAGSRGNLLAAVKAAAFGTAAPAPVISSVTASGFGQTAATIGWTTNADANTQVAYGLTSAYGLTTALNTTLTTSHSAALAGLNPGTLYHYSALSANSAGALATSPDATFTTVSGALAASFSDNFASDATNSCFPDGATFGSWTSVFNGYGCNEVESGAGASWLDIAPAASTAATVTHSTLVVGPAFAAPITFFASVYTNAQLRQNSAPNPWEVGWVLWDYTDGSHFYAFIAQPNGWELTKEDPSYPGSQRFLATGSSPAFPIESWYAVKIVQVQNVLTVYVNGQLVTSFTDTQNPYTAGNIALYDEDSDVHFEDVAVNIAAPVISSVTVDNVGQSSATVAWGTNEPADAAVEYGLTSDYSSTTTLNAALTTSHSAALSGLSAATSYHYAVLSHNIAGDLTVSPDFTFATISTGAAAPPVISSVAVYSVSPTSAAVSWTTNVPADTSVEYGLTAAYGSTTTLNAALTTSHSAVLPGLSAGTPYYYAVLSHDGAGDLTTDGDMTFTTAGTAVSTTTVMTTPFVNNFSSATLGACYADGSAFGPWTSASGGGGCTSAQTSAGRFWLDELPAVSTAAALTHSALVLGPAFAAPLTFSAQLDTAAQLRKNSPPNPGEVGALLWDYADNSHFYSFRPEPNGWQLIKEDPASPGSQRVLAAGTSPVFPLGSWYIVKITQNQNVLAVSVNGQQIAAFTDTQTPYASGAVGLGASDAEARFADVAVNAAPGAAPTVAVMVPTATAAVATVSNTTTLAAATSNNAAAALVQFLLDGAPLGPALVSPPFSMAWNTAADAPGSHVLTALDWDAQGDSSVSPPLTVMIAASAPGAGSQARAPQKFLSPALQDGINDVATFGTDAQEVSIYNVKGRLVFHGSQQGSPIVWNCRDAMGRVDESGVYIAKIRTADSGTQYQSFALVK